MPRKPKSIVLDSWAVIAYLEGEPSAKRVADHIADAHEEHIPLFMSVVNAGEVWYIIAREASVTDADRSITELRHLGIGFVDADWALARGWRLQVEVQNVLCRLLRGRTGEGEECFVIDRRFRILTS